VRIINLKQGTAECGAVNGSGTQTASGAKGSSAAEKLTIGTGSTGPYLGLVAAIVFGLCVI
jgi:hypothetical protein